MVQGKRRTASQIGRDGEVRGSVPLGRGGGLLFPFPFLWAGGGAPSLRCGAPLGRGGGRGAPSAASGGAGRSGSGPAGTQRGHGAGDPCGGPLPSKSFYMAIWPGVVSCSSMTEQTDAPELEEILLSLLGIPSLSGKEGEICSFIENLLRKRFQSGSGINLRRSGNSLLVWGTPDADRETLVLAGHLDTVPGDMSPGSRKRDGDRIFGLGASDMKGGDAVMLSLCSPDIFTASRFNLIFCWYAGEEAERSGNELVQLLPIIRDISHAGLAIILEPTENNLHLGSLGYANATVTFRGKRAHSARPWDGDNAVYMAIPLLQKLRNYHAPVSTIEGLEYRQVVTATMAAAGIEKNVVPDTFELNINYRFGPERDAENAREWFADFVGPDVEFEFTELIPAGPLPRKENKVFQDFRKRYSLPEEIKQAYTDVTLFGEQDIDAINFGPGLSSQAHQQNEFVPVANLHFCYHTLRGFIVAAS